MKAVDVRRYLNKMDRVACLFVSCEGCGYFRVHLKLSETESEIEEEWWAIILFSVKKGRECVAIYLYGFHEIEPMDKRSKGWWARETEGADPVKLPFPPGFETPVLSGVM